MIKQSTPFGESDSKMPINFEKRNKKMRSLGRELNIINSKSGLIDSISWHTNGFGVFIMQKILVSCFSKKQRISNKFVHLVGQSFGHEYPIHFFNLFFSKYMNNLS